MLKDQKNYKFSFLQFLQINFRYLFVYSFTKELNPLSFKVSYLNNLIKSSLNITGYIKATNSLLFNFIDPLFIIIKNKWVINFSFLSKKLAFNNINLTGKNYFIFLLVLNKFFLLFNLFINNLIVNLTSSLNFLLILKK